MNVKVFVSSTWDDLQAERAAVEQAVDRMARLEFSGMEHFGSSPRSARDESLERVDRADIYIGIFGGRYGSGITEEEYRRARTRNLPCLLYFKDEESILPEQRDSDPDRAAKRAAFYAELRDSRNGHLASEFSSPDQLAAKIATDLHNWLFERYLQAFVRGTAKLPTDYAARFRNYFVEYLGKPERPVPFGGREGTLAELDAWLADGSTPPYLLLTAGAGRGKSALLVHWARRLLSREDVAVVHLPVSIRFRTNLGAVVFASLAAQLAAYHNEEVPTDLRSSVEVWRGLVADYLQRPVPDRRRLVVILDGLDEAADWQAGADLFPRLPSPGLRLVVSARHTSEAPDVEAWRRRLGWEDPALARALDLDPLDSAGVADVLQRMGFPLDELSRRVDIISELYRLSGGDPLLVNLYVKDLWGRGQEAARLRPEDLQGIRPGLEGYFDRWWQDQRELWDKESPLREKSVQALLSLLTCAFGPLTRDDLLAVAPEDSGLSSWTIEDALRPLSRFIAGDGEESGYVFNHPRFSLYLYTKLSEAERRAWDARFIAWGKDVLARLASSQLAPTAAPAYLVQYFGSHLERAKAKPEDLLALICAGWRDAWLALEGGYSGFLADIDRAWRVVSEIDARAAREGRLLPHLHDEIRLALCRGSVYSLTLRIPPSLLARLVEEKVWSLAQAVAYALQLPQTLLKVQALGAISPHLPPAQRTRADQEALAAALSLQDPASRASALANLLGSLDPPPLGLFQQQLAAVLDDEVRTQLNRQAALALLRRGQIDAGLELLKDEYYLLDEGFIAAAVLLMERGAFKSAFTLIGRRSLRFGPDTRYFQLASQCLSAENFPAVLREAAAVDVPGWRGILEATVALRLADQGSEQEIRAVLPILRPGSEREWPCRLLEAVADLRRIGTLSLSASDREWISLLLEAPSSQVTDRHLRSVLLALQPFVSAALLGKLERTLNLGTAAGARLVLLLSDEMRFRRIELILEQISRDPNREQRIQELQEVALAATSANLPMISRIVAAGTEFEKKRSIEAVVGPLVAAGLAEEAVRLVATTLEPSDQLGVLIRLHGLLPEALWQGAIREALPGLHPDVFGEIPESLAAAHLFSGNLLERALFFLNQIGDLVPHAAAQAALARIQGTGTSAEILERLLREAERSKTEDFLVTLAVIALVGWNPHDLRRLIHELLAADSDNASNLPLFELALGRLPPPESALLRLEISERLLVVKPLGPVLDKMARFGWTLPEPLRERISYRELLEAVDSYQPPTRKQGDKGYIEAWLLHLLPEEEREAAARRIMQRAVLGDKGFDLSQMRFALSYLPPDEVDRLVLEVLASAEESRAHEDTHTIAVIAPYLTPKDRETVIVRALAIPMNEGRVLALTSLLPDLDPQRQQEILDQMFTESDMLAWAEEFGLDFIEPESGVELKMKTALLGILRRELTPTRLDLLFRSAEDLDFDVDGDKFLGAALLTGMLAPATTNFAPAELCRIVQSSLRSGRVCKRSRLLVDLAALAPVLVTLGGQGSIAEIRAAIEAACEMFP